MKNQKLDLTKIKISRDVDPTLISPRLFSNFMEQLGYSADGGALAQALANPTLERDACLRPEQGEYYLRAGKILTRFYQQGYNPDAIPDDFLICIDSSGFGVAVLDDYRSLGIPFPWAPFGLEGKATPASGRIGGGVRLQAVKGKTPAFPGERIAIDDGPSGLRQGIFLPFQRCLTYHGHLWVRPFSTREGVSGHVEVGLRRRLGEAGNTHFVGECLATEILPVKGTEWQKLSFHLKLPDGRVKPSEPVDFYFRWLPDGMEDLLVDRALLLPDDAIEDRFDPDVVRLSREWKPTLLRWPGGNFVSHYHWRDGTGPLDRRPTRRNFAWDGLETNFFGTTEFIHFCKLIGAQPHITVNTGTGSPEEAAAWVEYANGSPETPMGRLRAQTGDVEPYGVAIWEVGNEIHGSWQGGYHGADENAARFKEFTAAMRAVDPGIELIATGNQFDMAERDARFDFTNADQRWNRKLFEEASPDIDYLSLHSLPGNGSFPKKISHAEAYYALMAQPIAWEKSFIPELFSLAKTYLNRNGKPAKLAITEWGILGSLENRPEVRNYGAVPYAGVFLNSMVRSCDMVEITEATALLHGGAVHKGGGLVWFDPQYLVIQKFAEWGGGQRVSSTSDGPTYAVETPPDLGLAINNVLYVDVAVARLAGEPGGEVACLVNVSLDCEAPVRISVEAAGLLNVRWEYITWLDISAIAKPGLDERFRIVAGEPEISSSTIHLTLPLCSVSWLYYQRK